MHNNNKKVVYNQTWTAYNLAQTREIVLFDKLLQDLVDSVDEPPQQRGRPSLSLRESTFCAVQKVYSQLSSRRAHSLYTRAETDGRIAHAPNFNAVNKLMNREELTLILHELIALSAKPLETVETNFAVDSTGFRTTSFGRYCEDKHRVRKERKYLKAHITTGVKTNIVTSVRITDEHGADSPQLTPMIKETAKNGFVVKEVYADKAYSSRDNHEAIKELGGKSFIPFKKNAVGKMRGSMVWKRMYHFFQFNQEEFMEHYHKRSNVESTIFAIKAKFGETLKSKKPMAQRNELLCKILAYNITVLIHEMHELALSNHM
jgi:transposase